MPESPDAAASLLSDESLSDAWTYLLGRALVVRQEQIDLAEAGVSYNTIKYNPVQAADFVNPNFDVAYLESWIAVDDSASTILRVPEITGRYYTVQFANELGDVIANINERTMPETPSGAFVLHAPGASGSPGVGTPIALPGRKAKMLARVEIGDDLDGAIALQRAFTMETAGEAVVDPPVPLPMFTNAALPATGLFDWGVRLIDSAPDPEASLQGMRDRVAAIAELIAASDATRAAVEDRLQQELIPRFRKTSLTSVLAFRDGWLIVNSGGRYGDDYHVRAAQNLGGIWANDVAEVVYYIASQDGDGNPLGGGASYALQFPADNLPSEQATSYWSVILVDMPNYRVVPNALDRFNLNTYSSLASEPDGSLRIDIAPEPVPGRPESNWLPSPAEGAFSLTFRLYVPSDAAIAGEWSPPALIRLPDA